MSIFQNTCKPVGFGGRLMLCSMNIGHKKLHKWGFEKISIKPNAICLDIGCGGGTNLKRMLKKSPNIIAYGIDYSTEAIHKSNKKCKKFIKDCRCFLFEMDVLNMEFTNSKFDTITAFETIYFWKDLEKAFSNVYNILKQGGEFLICNESNGNDPKQEKWCKIIEGMKIYKIDEIKIALEKAGFKHYKIDTSHKNWLNIVAIK